MVFNTNSMMITQEEKEVEVKIFPVLATAIHEEQVHDVYDISNIVLHNECTLKESNFIVSVGGMSFPFRTAFNNIDQVVFNAKRFIKLVEISNISFDIKKFKDHLIHLAKSFNRKASINRATLEHKDFTWASEDVTDDYEELMQSGSLERLADDRMQAKLNVSFNITRVQQNLSNDIDYAKICEVATGMRIDTPDGFVKKRMPIQFRALQKQ